MLIPLFGIQIFLTVYRLPVGATGEREYEYATFIMQNTQVYAALLFLCCHILYGADLSYEAIVYLAIWLNCYPARKWSVLMTLLPFCLWISYRFRFVSFIYQH